MNLVEIKNNQPVTTSLQVAESFDKNHQHVLEAIDNLTVENPTVKNMFIEDEYTNSRSRTYRQVVMNRDGFTLLAMGFTGPKALRFKLEYIEAFNQMEDHIKQQLDTSVLSPELQFMSTVVQALTKQELATKQVETKIDNISNIVRMDTTDWRKNAVKVLRTIAVKQGGFEQFQEVANQSYQLLETRAKCDLSTRLNNRKKNMIVQGVGKTAVQKFNKMDVIAEDSRLTEIYLSVIKDMAIRYQIDFKEESSMASM